MAPSDTELLEQHVDQKYEAGFVTEVEAETFAPGLDEDVIRRLSGLKAEPDWMLEWRLKAFRHWQKASWEHSPGVSSMHSVTEIGPSSASMISATEISAADRARQ